MRDWLRIGFLLLALSALAVCAGAAVAQQYELQASYPVQTTSDPNSSATYPAGPSTYPSGPSNDSAASSSYPAGPSSDGGYRVANQEAVSLDASSGVSQTITTVGGTYPIERLPPIDSYLPQPVDPAAKLTQQFPGGLMLPDNEEIQSAEGQPAKKTLPPGLRREGCFQGITLGGSWLATGSGHDALGLAESSVEAELVLPSLVPESYLTIAPSYGIHRFDNPGGYDIPDEVHDAAVAFGIRGRANERLSYQAKVAVGCYSDFDNESSEQVRVRGFGMGLWKWNSTVDLMFGVAYVDLQNWPVVPIGGFVIRPDDGQEWRVTFPRMAYARRLCASGALGRPTEYWGSVGLEMGGGRWAVRTESDTTDDTTDDMTYSDWRLVLGLEQKTLDAYNLNFDVGYVFGRRIEYDDEHESFAPDDTISLTLTGRF
ncbi:MAG TPA: hypothetical protein VJL29_11495 [Thermoguttaceae bacterium]|nr:hypothetical protein [Thermoguttaceae bacterium]